MSRTIEERATEALAGALPGMQLDALVQAVDLAAQLGVTRQGLWGYEHRTVTAATARRYRKALAATPKRGTAQKQEAS